MIERELNEQWREYEFFNRVYRIDNPVKLVMSANGTTHRIVGQDGTVHCVPAPGYNGCVLRWQSNDAKKPVHF